MDINKLISTFLGDSLTNMLKKGSDNVTDKISHMVNNRILEYLVTEFKSNYKTKTLLYKVEPIELEKFYQPLYLRKVEHSYSSSKDTVRIGTEHLKDLFDKDKNCITIVGTAGSGKSTLVKYLFVDCIKEKYKIPIKIELRYLNKYNYDLQSYISDEIIKFNKIAEKENILENLLNSGKFVFFFDGYDEIISNKKEIITRDISKITKRYNKNDYLLTSRPFTNIEMLENFYNYEICDLEPEEINSFVRKQYDDSKQEIAENIIDNISKNKNKNVYDSLLRNPLLLSMFILTYEEDSYIPKKRSDYYYRVFNVLYSGHDTLAKFGYEREKTSGLVKEDFINLLKDFSVKSFFEERYYFSEKYFEEKMNQCKGKLGLKFDTDKLLNDLTVAIGILTKEGLEITFPHRSLQEYFAALFVTSLNHDNKLLFYKKLLHRFENNSFLNFIGYYGFIILLNEMDTINYLKQVFIPMLENIIEFIEKARINVDYNTFSLYKFRLLQEKLTKAYLFLIFSFSNNKNHQDFIELKKLDETISSIEPIEKIKTKLVYKEYQNVLDSTLKSFNAIISNIENEITIINKNDYEFINDLI